MITNIIFRRSDSPITSDKPHYPYELPKGWAWCRLDDLASYKKGPFGSSLGSPDKPGG